ncbi:S-adenosylmethionine decarboxylase proenzyme protein [Rutstroemia sp. NJR-2017a WRK4]|nr:S-adenosylmethionine decarboxylase proenzyme protein [Rutstroemia sp. NJR-2017a WRK4]
MGGRYPVLSPSAAIPVIQLKPSRTARILAPGIVFTTVVLLGFCTVIGIILSNTVYSSSVAHTGGVMTSQSFVLIASSFSVLYLLLHLIAAIKNTPVGIVRPPESRLHAYCFIVARVTLVCWLASVIASSVVVSKPNVCRPGTRDCRLQTAGIVISGIAFVATGVILTALEACQYPFQQPKLVKLPFMVTCRVSSFGEDMVDSNLPSSNASQSNILQSAFHMPKSASDNSMSTLHDDYLFIGNEKEEWEKARQLALATASITKSTNIKRKPLPKSASQTSIPGEFPAEHPVAPVLPMPTLSRTKSKDWGHSWSHHILDKTSNEKAISTSDSAISLGSDSSSEGTSPTRQTGPLSSISHRAVRPRNVTPSSSISDVSMRSPLSTMRNVLTKNRNAEFPEVAIKPDVMLVPTVTPPGLDRSSPKKSTITQPLPIAKLNELMRKPPLTRPSTMPRFPPVEELPPPPPLPPKHINPDRRKHPKIKEAVETKRSSQSNDDISIPLSNRKSSDEIKIPGAFVDYVPSVAALVRKPSCEIKIPGAFVDDSEDSDKILEEHAKKIEASIFRASKGRSRSPPKSLQKSKAPGAEVPKLYIPTPAGPRDKPFKRRPFFPRSNSGIPRDGRDSAQLLDAVKVEYTKVKPLRRLSLGEVTPGLGKIWDS